TFAMPLRKLIFPAMGTGWTVKPDSAACAASGVSGWHMSSRVCPRWRMAIISLYMRRSWPPKLTAASECTMRSGGPGRSASMGSIGDFDVAWPGPIGKALEQGVGHAHAPVLAEPDGAAGVVARVGDLDRGA